MRQVRRSNSSKPGAACGAASATMRVSPCCSTATTPAPCCTSTCSRGAPPKPSARRRAPCHRRSAAAAACAVTALGAAPSTSPPGPSTATRRTSEEMDRSSRTASSTVMGDSRSGKKARLLYHRAGSGLLLCREAAGELAATVAAAYAAVARLNAQGAEAGGDDLQHALQEGAVHGAHQVGVEARHLAEGAVVHHHAQAACAAR